MSKLPLERDRSPGVYRRGSKYVVIYRAGGRQRKQYADTLADARAIKLARDGEARALRRGPTLHGFSLSWLDRYTGTGHDSVRAEHLEDADPLDLLGVEVLDPGLAGGGEPLLGLRELHRPGHHEHGR